MTAAAEFLHDEPRVLAKTRASELLPSVEPSLESSSESRDYEAERRAGLAEIRATTAALQASEDALVAERLGELRQALHGEHSDQELLRQRRMVAIPAETVHQAREEIATEELRRRTREWNAETTQKARWSPERSGGVSTRSSTALFPPFPAEAPPTASDSPSMFTKQELIANDPKMSESRRKTALARAKQQSGERAFQKLTDAPIDEDVDSAFSHITSTPKKPVRPPTKIKWN